MIPGFIRPIPFDEEIEELGTFDLTFVRRCEDRDRPANNILFKWFLRLRSKHGLGV